MQLYTFKRESEITPERCDKMGEDGWHVVTVPSLPGCITQGKTIKETKENFRQAISLYLEPEEEIIPGKGARVTEVA